MNGKERTTKKMAERIVGHFVLKEGSCNDDDEDDDDDVDAEAPEKSVTDVWEPLPISGALADFFALGSRLPGEVRITSAILNVNNLRPIKLIRKPIGDGPDFNVVVAKDGENASSKTGPYTPWLEHQNSTFHDISSTEIDLKLNASAKRDPSLLDSLQNRQLVHPFGPNAPLLPFSPIACD